MGQMISKPDANPILLAILNWFFCIGYFMMGQKKKCIIGIVVVILTNVVTCGTLGWIVMLVFVYDAYLLGQKLQSGQSIGENENGLEFLNAIFKD